MAGPGWALSSSRLRVATSQSALFWCRRPRLHPSAPPRPRVPPQVWQRRVSRSFRARRLRPVALPAARPASSGCGGGGKIRGLDCCDYRPTHRRYLLPLPLAALASLRAERPASPVPPVRQSLSKPVGVRFARPASLRASPPGECTPVEQALPDNALLALLPSAARSAVSSVSAESQCVPRRVPAVPVIVVPVW